MSTLKSKASSLKHNIKDKILKATLALGLGAGGCAANQQYGDLPDSGDNNTPFPFVTDNGGGGFGNGDWANREHHHRDHGPQNQPHGGVGNHAGGHTGGGGHSGGGGHGGGGHRR